MSPINEAVLSFGEGDFVTLEHASNAAISNTSNLGFLEKAMLDQPQIDCPVTHKFGPGIYMREIFIPAGTLIIGRYHKFEHMNVFLKGKMTFLKDDGEKIELTAPLTMMSNPGQKLALTHEDCIWINVYATNETDIAKIEEQFLRPSEALNEHNKKQLLLLQNKSDIKGDLKCLQQ